MQNENHLPFRLRVVANKLRTSSVPLSDFIPLLQQAADRIDALEKGLGDLTDVALEHIGGLKCQKFLRESGQAYPRTCEVCGLFGKCKY